MVKRLISIIKFSFAVLILPILISVTISLFNHVVDLPKDIDSYFLWGIISYLILHLFIFEPTTLYEKGQDIVRLIFRFFSPLAEILSFSLPIYAIIVLIIYLVISLFSDISLYVGAFIFLISFSLVFHIINSAKYLSSAEDDFLKAHYFLSLELVYILNILITGVILRCLSVDFPFLDFLSNAFRLAKNIYFLAIEQLFM